MSNALRSCASRVAGSLRDVAKERKSPLPTIKSPALVAHALMGAADLSSAELSAQLVRLMTPIIARLIALGMTDEAGAHHVFGKRIEKASSLTRWLESQGVEAPAGISTELPADLKAKIAAATKRFMDQPWWGEVGQEIRDEIGGIIERGIVDGKTYTQIRQDLEMSGAKLSRARALRIARTEVNAAIQAGRHELLEELSAETGGLMGGKEWIAILDSKTRQSHWDADGQIKRVDEPFLIGGHPAQYPGDPQLPVGERANCRCIVLSATLDEVLEKPPLTARDVPARVEADAEEFARAEASLDVSVLSGNATAAMMDRGWEPRESLAELQAAAEKRGLRIGGRGFDKEQLVAAGNDAVGLIADIATRFPSIGRVLRREPLRLTLVNAAEVGTQGGEYTAGATVLAAWREHTAGKLPMPLSVESNPTLGGEFAANGSAHVLRHELAHHVDRVRKITTKRGRTRSMTPAGLRGAPKFRGFLAALQVAGGPAAISLEASLSPQEAFAEALAVILHPFYGRDTRLPEVLETWLVANVLGGISP